LSASGFERKVGYFLGMFSTLLPSSGPGWSTTIPESVKHPTTGCLTENMKKGFHLCENPRCGFVKKIPIIEARG
jgi:hypothetical protein